MSIYTNTQRFSYMHNEDGAVVLPCGSTFKLICYESFGILFEAVAEDGKKVRISVNLDIFQLIFKEVDL